MNENHTPDFHVTEEQARIISKHMQIAGSICQQIPSIYRVHGDGQAQESQILTMLRAALDSMEKARACAVGDDSVLATVDHGIAFLMAQIDDHREMRDAWAVAHAMIEAAKATKH